MKKAKKIVIAVVGGVAAIGAVIAGKSIYDKNQTIFYQTDYGIPYTLERSGLLERYRGTIDGFDLEVLISDVSSFNREGFYDRKIIVSLDGKELSQKEIDDNNFRNSIDSADSFNVSFEYGSDGYISRVIVSKVPTTNRTESTEISEIEE